MSDAFDKEIQRSLIPSLRLIGFYLSLLLAIALFVVYLTGKDIPFISPGPALFIPMGALFLLALAILAIPLGASEGATGGSGKKENEFRPDGNEATTRLFKIEEALDFYDRIADLYDARLTREYMECLRRIADVVEGRISVRKGKPVELLDVGAGTGQLIRLLERNQQISWTCVEPSVGMSTHLRRLYEGPPREPQIYSYQLESCPDYLESRRFDVIVLCFVLSSLKSLPSISSYARLLSADGIIIVVDAHPGVREQTPEFRVRTFNGIASLQIQHRSSTEVIHHFQEHGFHHVGEMSFEVRKHGKPYAFGSIFRK